MAKVLLWDIETSPLEARTFGLRADYIHYTNIVKDWFIICGAWKWLSDNTIYSTRCADIGDDRKCVSALRHAVNEADIIVHHNGDKFDIKKLNARVIYHNLPPMKKPAMVDTLKAARKEFAFTSNRLDYIGKHLLDEGKIETSNLWNRVMDRDPGSIDEMVKYNKQDVLLLEKVYLKLRPHMSVHPNMALFADLDRDSCPRCSGRLYKDGWKYTHGGRYQQYECADCGHKPKGRKQMNNTLVVS
jgi:DNA polymerase elongation subunit (family B)